VSITNYHWLDSKEEPSGIMYPGGSSLAYLAFIAFITYGLLALSENVATNDG